MKKVLQVSLGSLFCLSSFGQNIFEPEEWGFQFIYGDTKFENAQKFSFRALAASQYSDYYTPKTTWMCDLFPFASLFLHKRVDLLIGAGAELHKIRNDFRPEIAQSIGINEKYKKYKTNVLCKAMLGGQFFLIGNRYKMINLRLITELTIEGFIKNNTGAYVAIGPFEMPIRVYDYAGNPLRIGIDVIPLIHINISQVYSFQAGGGYSFGLNKSNKRVAVFTNGSGATSAITIFTRKESTFIFSAGIIYNLSDRPRRSLKTWSWKAFKEAFNFAI